jgi:hypothetical protein
MLLQRPGALVVLHAAMYQPGGRGSVLAHGGPVWPGEL